MEKIIQVFRYAAGNGLVVDAWEISAASAVNALVGIVTRAYTDGSGDTYRVLTLTARPDQRLGDLKLCWDVPPGCRKERLCVVIEDENRLEDFRKYCVDFLS